MTLPAFIKQFMTVIVMVAAHNLYAAEQPAATPDSPKAILVTGASSGIGLKITELLASQGYFVYAGARKEEDLIALNKIPNVQSIRLDVTRQEDIDKAVATVTQAGRGLYGLVNNAGVAVWGPLVETSEEDFHFVMNVNLYGPYRITKAFHPLIVASKGRIIMTGSLFGIFSGPMIGPYAMSKHGIEAFTDTLADEMAPYGVKVSVIEPGTYKTQIYKNSYARAFADHKISYEEMPDWQKQLYEKGPGVHDNYPPPDKVAEAVSLALFSKHPKRRYLVVPEAQQATSTLKAALKKVVQLNDDQPYSLDRAALVKMLEEEINKQEKARLKK
jgi:NAD(P)-dependent dehydrogenase (short-subunit alcohol dehydrogenase family)